MRRKLWSLLLLFSNPFFRRSSIKHCAKMSCFEKQRMAADWIRTRAWTVIRREQVLRGHYSITPRERVSHFWLMGYLSIIYIKLPNPILESQTGKAYDTHFWSSRQLTRWTQPCFGPKLLPPVSTADGLNARSGKWIFQLFSK